MASQLIPILLAAALGAILLALAPRVLCARRPRPAAPTALRAEAAPFAPGGAAARAPGFPRQRVRVVTYNVLSTAYAGDMVVPSPGAADNRARLALLRDKLAGQLRVAGGAVPTVFALQEVSLRWSGELAAFFAGKGYACVAASYGSPRSDSMGVLLAYPRGRFLAERMLVESLAGVKPPPPAAAAAAAPLPWPAVRQRDNQVAHVRLRPLQGGGRPFAVSTVHLPCEFWDPPAMRVYAALAAQAARAFAGSAPFVLCGDFNVQPGSGAYDALTAAGASARDAPPPEFEGDAWAAAAEPPLRSAYRLARQGKEPPFTTAAWQKRARAAGEPMFVGCLDYIFLSGEWACNEVVSLPEAASLLPTEAEPSDHHLLAAVLDLDLPVGGGGGETDKQTA